MRYLILNWISHKTCHFKKKVSSNNSTYLWHIRLGHINLKRIDRLVKDFVLFDYSTFTCVYIVFGRKNDQKAFFETGPQIQRCIIINSYKCVWTPRAREFFEYFITFIDDYSRYGHVYLLYHKFEAFEKFKKFRIKVKKQLDKNIKSFRTDRSGEYLFGDFDNIFWIMGYYLNCQH